MKVRNRPNPIGQYVYEYVDLRDNTVFYVGNGKDYRWKQHTYKAHLTEKSTNQEKVNLIKLLLSIDMLDINIVQDDMNIDDAYSLEHELICKYKRIHEGGTLVNATKGLRGGIDKNPEVIEKHRLGMINRYKDQSQKDLTSTQTKERNTDPVYKQKWIDSLKVPKIRIECPHCNLIGGANNMYRYHFDKCKQKGNNGY